MGYIYKIQNKINDKIYIGQTVASPQRRWTQHKNNIKRDYLQHIALYKAMNKYGIENFTFEVLEEVSNNLLDEREKYWIKNFNSYGKNGYNMTLGGRCTKLYNWDELEIIELYYKEKSARKVAKIIGCDHSTIDKILNANNIPRFSIAQQISKRIVLEKDDKYLFETTSDAAKWLIETGKTRSKNFRSIRQQISEKARVNGIYFGFKVYYESKIQSIPTSDSGI